MPENPFPFRTLLFGFAFSPTLEANLWETTRIAYSFGARLILLHVGEQTEEKTIKINRLLEQVNHKEVEIEIHWELGKPVDTILKACHHYNADLLILGAQQHENMYQFYVGSIARQLTRKVSCSVLLLIRPSVEHVPFKHIVVNGLDAPETTVAITDAFHVANAFGAKQITIVEEIKQKEVHVEVVDDKSLQEASLRREELKMREDSRVQRILNDLPQSLKEGIKLKTQSIFGQRGYSIGHYAEVVRADLLVMNAPHKTRLIDRIFPHDIEHILSDLPTDLLIIRK